MSGGGDSLLLGVLSWGVYPAWLLAGAADWWCHRRTLIHRTSGARESWLHLVMYAQVALPVVAALFLRVNLLLLGSMLACVLAHFACSLWDTTYSQPRRYISPVEQQVHSFLEMLPLFALVLVLLLHWGELGSWEWRLVPREPEVSGSTLALVLAPLAAALALIAEELWRCHHPGRLQFGTEAS